LKKPALLLGLLLQVGTAAWAAPSGESEPESPPATQCKDEEKKTEVRLLVLSLEARDTSPESAQALAQTVADEAARMKGYAVLTQQEVRSALDQEAQKQLLGCDDESCLSEIAAALDVDLLVSGSLGLEGDARILALSLTNVRAMVTVNRVTLAWPGPVQDLPAVARSAAQLLLLRKEQRPPGSLVLEGLPEGTRVLLDEEDRSGDVRSGELAAVEVGPRVLHLQAPGYREALRHVLVESGKKTTVDAHLKERGIFESWWLWGAVSATLVAGVVAGGLVLWATRDGSLSIQSSPPPADVGVEDVLSP
jgi:hypothetical protein